MPVEYLRIETGGTAGGMLKRPSEKPPPECGSNAFVCSFEVDDFDQTAANIQQWGGQLQCPNLLFPAYAGRDTFLTQREIPLDFSKQIVRQDNRVTQAFLPMKKLIISELQKAYQHQ